MSLYREVGSRHRWIAVAALGGLAVGLLLGVFAGRAMKASPSLHAQAAATRGQLREVVDAAELVAIEYAQAVRHGKVVAETELAAAQADLDRARRVLEASAPDLDALSPGAAQAVGRELEKLAALVASRASADAVKRQAARAREAVRAAAG